MELAAEGTGCLLDCFTNFFDLMFRFICDSSELVGALP